VARVYNDRSSFRPRLWPYKGGETEAFRVIQVYKHQAVLGLSKYYYKFPYINSTLLGRTSSASWASKFSGPQSFDSADAWKHNQWYTHDMPFRHWYVANVSIIFDAPCLFYTNSSMFYLHFVALLYIFWHKPINNMPQCQFHVFCCFCISEKLYR
jgi:hypothetical protein